MLYLCTGVLCSQKCCGGFLWADMKHFQDKLIERDQDTGGARNTCVRERLSFFYTFVPLLFLTMWKKTNKI
jgi:hypothetical protein